MALQSRIFLTAAKSEAERVFSILERAFEDEGLPISMFEIDEDREIFEVSTYTFDPDTTEPRIKEALGSDAFGLELRREAVPDIDWVAYSLEGLTPVRAGRFFVHGSHDRDKRQLNDLGIEIDAGLAFGTGHHGTTSGCLELLGEVIRRDHPRNALDLGTGSGVLAIAIAKLARIPVLATDIDPVATAVARANIRNNGVAAMVQARTSIGFHDIGVRLAAPFDLIVANILARPLMRLAPDMRRHLARRGSVVLSGILASQRDKVLAAYRTQGLYHRNTLHREGWVTLHLKA